MRTAATNRSAASGRPGAGRDARGRGEGVGWAQLDAGRCSATNPRAASGRPGAGRAPSGGVGTAALLASRSRGPDPTTYGSGQSKTGVSCPLRVGDRRRVPTAAFLHADLKCSTVRSRADGTRDWGTRVSLRLWPISLVCELPRVGKVLRECSRERRVFRDAFF